MKVRGRRAIISFIFTLVNHVIMYIKHMIYPYIISNSTTNKIKVMREVKWSEVIICIARKIERTAVVRTAAVIDW